MKAAVIVFPGSNCDRDVATTLKDVTGTAPIMIWHQETSLPPVDLIVLPGGFSYGDYLRSGAMAAHSSIMSEIKSRSKQGVAVLGICNGFQILTESGLLPGALTRNRDLRYICKHVRLKVERDNTLFTRSYQAGETITLPIAHKDGAFIAEKETLSRLEGEGQIVFRYAGDDDENPNGSMHGIAAIIDEKGRTMGMMPHPERASEALCGGTDGRRLFESLCHALA